MPRLESNLTIGKPLGSGHFGDVHLGIDDVHGEVAVKILKQRPGETIREWKERKYGLLAEGQCLSQARHPNVVSVHHLLESPTDDSIHLVMEFCPGGSLQSAFESGPMTLGKLRNYTTGIVTGLGVLHNRGMLHRDIKPGNILIDSCDIAKLGDFGLVTDDLILGYGSVAGYRDHLAPEVYKGGPTSQSTDLWALGMTMYRLLHGATWYGKWPPPYTLIPKGGFAKSLKWLPHISREWRRFIRKAMNDDPRSRFRNASEFVNALGQLPVGSGWECDIVLNQVKWRKSIGDRNINVTWIEHAQHNHEWFAISEPISAGRRRTLGSSNGIVSRATAERGLEDFFSTHS